MDKKELETLALRKAAQGKHWKKIVLELINKGIDVNTSVAIARQATRRYIWYVINIYICGFGFLMIIAGGILSFSWIMSGKFILIAIGLLVVGFIMLLTGLSGAESV
jgi:hypothetical protein